MSPKLGTPPGKAASVDGLDTGSLARPAAASTERARIRKAQRTAERRRCAVCGERATSTYGGVQVCAGHAQTSAAPSGVHDVPRDEHRVTVFINKYVPSPATESDDVERDAEGDVVRYTGDVIAATLDEALTRHWPTDAHMAAYAPAIINGDPLRLSGDILDDPEGMAAIGGAIRMTVLVADLDDPEVHGTPTPARAEWRAEQRSRIAASGLASYETRGGFRLLRPLARALCIASRENAATWTYLYLGWCEWLEQTHGLAVDRSCADWTRLYRLPNVRRDRKPARAAIVGALAPYDPIDAEHWIEPPSGAPRTGANLGSAPPTPDDDDIPEPTEDMLAIDRIIHPRWLAGGRIETYAWFHLCGWALGKGCPKAELSSLRRELDRDEPSAAKRREHKHILKRACAIDGPGGARVWLGDDFEAVDKIIKRAEKRWKAESGAAKAKRDGAEPANDDDDAPLILVCERDAGLVLLWRDAEQGHQTLDTRALKLLVKRYGLKQIKLTEDVADRNGETKTRAVPTPELIQRYGTTFRHAEYDFARARTGYDPSGDGRVIVGYSLPNVEPRHDPAVDAWLRALGGDEYPRLEQWIASCAQGCISRLAAALVILGPADVGKSLLADGCAGLWHVAEPPAAELLVSRFNGDLTRCPVVFDDEAQLFGSRKLSTKKFREVIQSTERTIERKGREMFMLRGAMRLIVAGNGFGDLNFTDVTGRDVVDAVADRLLVIDASPRAAECKRALAALRPPDEWRVDMPRIVGHLAWIAVNVELTAERFIGAGGAARDAILASHGESYAALWDTLLAWLDTENPKSPWCANEGRLCVNVQKLAEWLDTTPGTRGKGWDVARVQNALRPVYVEKVRPREGTDRPRLWALDAGRVAAMLGADEARVLNLRAAASRTPPAARAARLKRSG